MQLLEKEYNLLDEPWIRVMRTDCMQEVLSIKEVLFHAHEYEDLSGETAIQDIALFRFLLAIVHAVFFKVDENGAESAICDTEEAFRRWKALWDMGEFPKEPIGMYLEKYRERFWLFHPETPFYQVPEASIGTPGAASKLNGEISESANKVRLFASRAGDSKNELEFSEAARWLIHLNAFDDAGLKQNSESKKKRGSISIGRAWLGELGLIQAVGNNLFESLMLNLVLVHDGEIWEAAEPIWEVPEVEKEERIEIPIPNDQAKLLTIQSRRIQLIRKNGKITGYSILGGDFFTKENAFSEQMTLWRRTSNKMGFIPKTHQPERKLWRDFSALITKDEYNRRPGIVSWIMDLKEADCIAKKKYITYQIVSVEYDKNVSSIVNVIEDSLTLHSSLLLELGRKWNNAVIREVEICEKLAYFISDFEKKILIASGKSQEAVEKQTYSLYKEKWFYEIDVPFCAWLYSLDPENRGDDFEKVIERWRAEERGIALRIAREMIDDAGPEAFMGKFSKSEDKKKNKKESVKKQEIFSLPEAYNLFLYNIGKTLTE